MLICLSLSASDVLQNVQECIGALNSDEKRVVCQLMDGRQMIVFVASSEMIDSSESVCFQKALARSKMLAGSDSDGYQIDSVYQRERKSDSDSLSVYTTQRLESELSSQISGFFEVFRGVNKNRCFVGVSQDYKEVHTSSAVDNKTKLIVKGRVPFKDVITTFPEIGLKEGASIIRLKDHSYLVVASGMSKGQRDEAKAYRIAETRAQVNLARLFYQEKVFEYTLIETSFKQESSSKGTISEVKPKQIFASFVGFSEKLNRLQPVHCHWHDFKKPDQRWALVGFHVSQSGELISHNQPWGL